MIQSEMFGLVLLCTICIKELGFTMSETGWSIDLFSMSQYFWDI
jgi:hypothetical protein